jgi:hypothetical protein
MQLAHLGLAIAVWLSLILLGASAFAVRSMELAPEREPEPDRLSNSVPRL